MQWSVTAGRIAGTAIRIHITFILFLAWIAAVDYARGGWDAAGASLVFIILLFACVVAHEFGHILVARSFGVRTPEVILLPIGGVANMERMPENPRQELLIALAGPMVNVVIAAALLMLGGLPAAELMAADLERASLLQRLAFTNVALVIFNLLPAFPMDGGRVLRALLSMRLGPQRAISIAAKLGQAFAFLFVALGILYNPILILVGLFVYIAAEAELQASVFHSFASGLKVSDAMERSAHALQPDAVIADAVEALLATAQSAFPVMGAAGKPIGVLGREELLAGLKQGAPGATIAAIMRDPALVSSDAALDAALAEMSQRGIKSRLVVDGNGRLAGILTLDNLVEMMMIHTVRPDWKFSNRPM